jgi:hypothetical protein
MEAVAWTAIGLLAATQATLVAVIIALFGRTEGQFSRIDAKFDAVNVRIDDLISQMNARFDGVTRDIANVAGRLAEHMAERRH